MDARGYVKVTGRVKEMIIRGGENLFPAEIENAILEHAEIGEVAVVGVPCPEFGEQVACFMAIAPHVLRWAYAGSGSPSVGTAANSG